MTGLTQRGQARVDEFLSTWESRALGRSATAKERDLIREALVGYLLAHNSYSTRAQEIANTGFAALDAMTGDAADVRTAIVDLRDQLDLQDDLNLALREHLISLSDQVARVRMAHR